MASDDLRPSADALYNKWRSDRDCYLEEAYRSAKVTLPALVPDTSDIKDKTTPRVLDKPFQSLGARGVNNLASKLVLTLFPPTSPFMKYTVTGEAVDRLDKAQIALQSEVHAKLAARERRIQDRVDASNVRTKVFDIIRHLLVSGNKLVRYDGAENKLRTWNLNSYVARWDDAGNLLDCIVVEKLDRRSITNPNILAILGAPSTPDDSDEEPVCVYTRIRRVSGKKMEEWTEVEDVEVQGSRRTYTEGKNFPWLVLRHNPLDGEDYGRGFVEEYRGDLTSTEQLSRDRQFLSANMAKVLWRISANSILSPTRWDKLDNGDSFVAEDGDIECLAVDKGSDASWVAQNIQELKQDLSASFLLNSSFQRQQERVTAEEIRRMAEELDDTLGGLFSALSQELQLPLARLIEAGTPNLPPLDDSDVKISVVTGLAAIGRGQDLQRFREAFAIFADLINLFPDLPHHLSTPEAVRRVLTGTGVEPQGLQVDAEQAAATIQQAQQAEAARTVGTDLSGAAGQSLSQMPPEQMLAMIQQAMGGGNGPPQ